ncbi:MAG: ABC transporter permease [Thermoproteus sp.]
MRAGLYLAARHYTRYYALSLAFSLIAPFISGLFYLASWAVTGGRADIEKFLYQLIGVVLIMLAQLATSDFLWTLHGLMSGGQLEYLAASPAGPLPTLASYYLVQLVAFGTGISTTTAVVVATIKGPIYGVAVLLAVAVAAASSLPLIGIALCLAYLVPYLRSPSPITMLLNVAIVFLGGVMYPASVLPSALRLVSSLLPFAEWAELVRGVALSLEIPPRALGPLLGYMAYFALGLLVWRSLMIRFKKSGLYHVW